jgi:hypothetical protein
MNISRMRPLLLLFLPALVASLAVRPKLTASIEGGSGRKPTLQPPKATAGPRDVVVKVYDLATPPVMKSLELLTGKDLYWFPKLTVGIGGRTWTYDGEVERTVDAIVENAANGAPLRTFNLGPTELSDEEVDALLVEMSKADYSSAEYDFFFRNCNHFCDDFSQRLLGDAPGSGVDREFMEKAILEESESLLCKMPGFQQSITRSVTFQIQKAIVKAWRKEWKRALAEYAEEHGDAELASVVGVVE